MRASTIRFATLLLTLGLTAYAVQAAQPTFGLLHSLFDPGTNAQADARQGYSVAVDGNIAVVGVPYAYVGWPSSGVVKVYDATTGALLHTVVNPTPNNYDTFGFAVAISGPLMVAGAPGVPSVASDVGRAYVYDLSSDSPTAPIATLTNSYAVGGDRFGAAVAISGRRVVVGVPYANIGVSAGDAGRAFVYDLSSAAPALPVATLTSPTPEPSGYFGNSVGISGTQVVVGAPGEGSWDDGRAYVYNIGGVTPTVPVLTLSRSAFSPNNFGSSVAISGTRVAVGAPNQDTGAFVDAGSAFVFDLANVTPTIPVLTLTNPSPAASDYFGYAVTISGGRIVVGAYQDDTGATNAGSAYVYDLANGIPAVPVVTLTNSSPGTNDYFGWSVAISGSRVVVAAVQDNAGATNAGSAYAYDIANPSPATPLAALASPSPAIGDSFGFAMAISHGRLVVGAFQDDTGAVDAGSAYVFDLTSGTPSLPVIALTNPVPAQTDYFGFTVAVSDSRVVVGAYQNDTGASNAGIAYVYHLASATPMIPEFTLTNPSPAANDNFGGRVAISGQWVVVSANGKDIGTADAGAAYVYDLGSPSSTLPVLTLTNPSPAVGDFFGNPVAISGNRVIIGASQDDTGAINSGSAYVYDLAGATPRIPTLTLTNPTPAPDDRFGSSVAISGTLVVVGAYLDDTTAGNNGIAYVFDLASATPAMPAFTLFAPTLPSVGWFGASVAISGNQVVVGAQLDAGGNFNAGSAYVYDLSSAAPIVPVAVLLNPHPDRNDYFGAAVAIDGATVIAGAYGDNTPSTDRGAAYVFGLRPALSIAPAASGFITLSWTPTNAAGFVLKYTDSLAPTNWLNAPSGAMNPVTIPTTNVTRFYRVAQP
jgi:drug/metabolite transporter superfamily protein YnfA